MLKRTLQIVIGILILAGCRQNESAPPPVEPPPPDTHHTPPPQPSRPEKAPPEEAATSSSKAQESSLTDSSGQLLTGVLEVPPNEIELGVPIFQPSQITETDASAYRLVTNDGTVMGMSFATAQSQDEVKRFYEQALDSTSWEAGVGRLSGRHNGRRVVVIIQPGATCSFELQVWS